ncbi:CBU_0592 family membrane protein [Parvularcula lutaonensis]|uniref:CBU-0592-like domain-containing protein n=1 Tax=Parvularcula lutaonensis TaxID=491923 RepID=A0ABV7M8P0_9PROT|nr:hypothetical protein [Parvularcula lutaonensis]GGY45358.1 hypothetical protein GCM10007148_12910 [Parvularcula lutaonensis]
MIFDTIGIIGVLCILAAYFLLQTEKIRSDELRYPVLNLVGAVLILISLIHTFNLASFVIEICWIAISLYGIAKILRSRRSA